uniref:Uncharacterized protein n=1 Tax=viral metagenome TaxID=1070528 RepID=A0A6M3L6W1_9ZZZZ
MWGMVTCVIYAIANFIRDIPEEWKFVITVAAPFVAALILLIANPIWRWYKMHNPLKVTYLIPRTQYSEISFLGAGNEEGTPSELTVGIGYYRVIHLIIPKREIDIGSVKLRFSGPAKNKPKQRGVDNPYWISDISGRSDQPVPNQYLNWDGEVYSFPDIMKLPLHLIKKEPLIIGNGIETIGAWEGEIILVFPIYKWRRIEKSLKFRVTDGSSDDIPFLRGERNPHGRYKEIQERYDSNKEMVIRGNEII